MLPRPLDPYVFPARVHRVIDGDSIKLHLDQGFGTWKICTIHPGADKEARYPQGVYRLSGIDAPERRGATKAAGLESMARVNELLSLGSAGDSVLVKSNKEKEHGKYLYMLDLYVPVDLKDEEDYEAEAYSWLEESEIKNLISQISPEVSSTIRALATEVMAHRQAARSVIHVNQQLLEEGLAVPYFGGKKG
jgi:endonuclease YncB( thermonuclease family)